MRQTRYIFAALAFATSLVAADPFVGTWKLNPAKSNYKTGTPSKEQTLTIKEVGADLDIAVKGTAGDGTALASHFTVPAAGGPGKVVAGPWDTVAGKRTGATERETLYSKGGKVVYTTHAKIAADGKTVTVNSKGLNAVGQTVEGSVTYEKQ